MAVTREIAQREMLGTCRSSILAEPHERTSSCVDWRPIAPPEKSESLRDYTSAERKEMPLWSVMAQYFPDAFMALARLSKKANDKHNPGERMHWVREKSKDHLECATRHLLTPDKIDPETGEIELVAAMWRCAAALQEREEARLVAAGIKPLSGVIAPAPPVVEPDWIPWTSGECPVPSHTRVGVKLRGDGNWQRQIMRADSYRWYWKHGLSSGLSSGDIIAYRVVPK